jgi:hypothetical protein
MVFIFLDHFAFYSHILFFGVRILLYSPGWPRTHVPPASTSQVLALYSWATILSHKYSLRVCFVADILCISLKIPLLSCALACIPVLGSLRQEDHLSPGVLEQPGQHSETLSQKKKKKLLHRF